MQVLRLKCGWCSILCLFTNAALFEATLIPLSWLLVRFSLILPNFSAFISSVLHEQFPVCFCFFTMTLYSFYFLSCTWIPHHIVLFRHHNILVPVSAWCLVSVYRAQALVILALLVRKIQSSSVIIFLAVSLVVNLSLHHYHQFVCLYKRKIILLVCLIISILLVVGYFQSTMKWKYCPLFGKLWTL